VEELHERERHWDREWPFRTMDELVRATERLLGLVEEAEGAAEFSVEVAFPNGTRRTSELGEFATAAAQLDIGRATSFHVDAEHHDDDGVRGMRASMFGLRSPLGPALALKVYGRRATAVAGVATQIEDMVTELFEAIDRDAAAAREAEAKSHASETPREVAAVTPLPSLNAGPIGSVEPSGPWYHHPWTVTIVGGVVAAVIAALVIAIVT
jgi:hypothetical protein